MYLRRVYCKDALFKVISNQYARCQGTSAAASLDNPQPFSAIPLAPGAVPLLGHMPFMAKKETQERLHEAFDNLRKKAGDVYRLSIPGEPGFVAIFQPEHVKTLYSVDGRIPNLPGFDPFEYIRKNAMKDRYMITGLINNSEDWYTVRHQVQQDMMRPKSALYYIDDLDDIAGDLADRISTEKSLNDGSVEDMYPILQAFALEAVGSIFLGSRLGAIKGEGDGQRLIEIAEEGLPIVQQLMFIPPKLFRFLPMFKKFVSIQGEAFDICKRHLDETMSKTKDSDETVIAKLMRACGPDSAVPLIMGIDALQVFSTIAPSHSCAFVISTIERCCYSLYLLDEPFNFFVFAKIHDISTAKDEQIPVNIINISFPIIQKCSPACRWESTQRPPQQRSLSTTWRPILINRRSSSRRFAT